MRAPQVVRDFLKWRWAPVFALTASSLFFVGLAVLFIPDPVGRARAARVDGGLASSRELSAPASPAAGTGDRVEVPPRASQASSPLANAPLVVPPSDELAEPIGKPLAALQAATHARESRRRGRPVVHVDPATVAQRVALIARELAPVPPPIQDAAPPELGPDQ
jgi:hypothetical protein